MRSELRAQHAGRRARGAGGALRAAQSERHVEREVAREAVQRLVRVRARARVRVRVRVRVRGRARVRVRARVLTLTLLLTKP